MLDKFLLNNYQMKLKRKDLIKKAEAIYGKIYPCKDKATIHECFTEFNNNNIRLWFNTEDGSTHMISNNTTTIFHVISESSIRRRNKQK